MQCNDVYLHYINYTLALFPHTCLTPSYVFISLERAYKICATEVDRTNNSNHFLVTEHCWGAQSMASQLVMHCKIHQLLTSMSASVVWSGQGDETTCLICYKTIDYDWFCNSHITLPRSLNMQLFSHLWLFPAI